MSKLPDYASALAAALVGVPPRSDLEEVALADAASRVLAEPVRADRDLPPFNRAQMDGYALRAIEFAHTKAWPVAHTIAAGASAAVQVPPGHCVAIATGAPVPEGLDAVIQHELSDRGDRTGQPVRFRIDSITPGHAVHSRGADARAGDTLIAPSTALAAHHLGIAAAVGTSRLKVVAKPQAIVLTSGDEVVGPSEAAEPHQIRNSNSVQTCELLRRFGAVPVESHHLPDEHQATIAAVRRALSRADLVITIGGVSAGERDHFPAAFEACGVTALVKGASIQPGRPIYVGTAPDGTMVIGLPGNPVSALVCACLFVWPIVRAMLGLKPDLLWRLAQLAEPVKPNPHRRAFRPAIVQPDGSVIVPAWAGSGDLAHTAPTHGMVELHVQEEPVQAGATLRFLAWP